MEFELLLECKSLANWTWFRQCVHECTVVRIARACVQSAFHVHATGTGPEGHVERRSLPLPHLGREKAVPGFLFLFLFF